MALRLRFEPQFPVPRRWRRAAALGAMALGALLLWLLVWLWDAVVLEMLARLWRRAPIVEQNAPVLLTLPAFVVSIQLLLGGAYMLVHARPIGATRRSRMEPPRSRLDRGMEKLMLGLTWAMVACLAIGAVLAAATFAATHVLDYRACPQLRELDRRRTLFLVNNDAYCFRPERFIERNWPCRRIADGRLACLRSDGK